MKQLHQDLETHLESMLRQIPALLWTTDTELRYTSLQGTALQYLNFGPDEYLGKPIGERPLSSQDGTRSAANAAHLEALQGSPATYSIHASGRTLEAHVGPLRGPDGDLTGCIGIALETSGRKNAESLRVNEERFRTMLDNARDVVFRIDLASRRYDYVSPSASVILGVSPAELMETGLAATSDRVHPDDRGMFLQNLFAPPSGSPARPAGILEFRWLYAPGEYRWINATWSLLGESGSEPAALVVTMRDITDRRTFIEELTRSNQNLRIEIERRREMELALESSEIRYRAIVEKQVDMVCRYRPDGTLTFVNEAYSRFFGMANEELVGSTFTPPVHPDDLPDTREKTAAFSPANPL